MASKLIRPGDDPEAILEAAERLRRGELVAFPTETVYGLGADARSLRAVEAIYRAKDRPSGNPLIVHVAGAAGAAEWVEGWDERAEKLAQAFWPGPLTLVLRRAPAIPAIVSAGGPTLAVRAPAHPVARALLQAFGGPIAAPSANRSSGISPTSAQAVEEELGDRVPLILDGGPCTVGLESTVLDLADDPPVLLRPGAITPSMLERVLGGPVELGAPRHAGALRSPGLLLRHYAPRTQLVVADAEEIRAVARSTSVVLTWTGLAPAEALAVRLMPSTPEGYARALYEALRWADRQGAARIYAERPPEGEPWTAVHDRLTRAAAPA